MLAGYERVLPGAADRIFKLAENEAQADIANRATLLDQRQELLNQRGRGQIFGFTLAILALVIAAILILADKSTAGLVLIAVEALAVASVLITGTVGRRQRARDEGAEDEEVTEES